VSEAAGRSPDAPLVGIDLGGTSIRAVVFGAGMEVLGKREAPTHPEEGAEKVISRMAGCVRAAVGEAAIEPAAVAGVGVGAAGLTDWKTGTVLLASNLGWKDVPLAEKLSRELGGVRVAVDKDTNAAALAERRLGAGRLFRHFLYVTAGTGIGGGLVLNGELYRGATGGAGDIGHTVVDPDGPPCGCGSRGCVEVFSSGGGIVNRVQNLLSSGRPGTEGALLEGGELTAEAVFKAASEGDPVAGGVVRRAGTLLGLALANYVNLNNPEAVVLGGGLLRAGDLYREPVEREMRSRALPALAEVVRLVSPELGENVGAVGAALLAGEAEREKDQGGV
jgi:glucokinase